MLLPLISFPNQTCIINLTSTLVHYLLVLEYIFMSTLKIQIKLVAVLVLQYIVKATVFVLVLQYIVKATVFVLVLQYIVKATVFVLVLQYIVKATVFVLVQSHCICTCTTVHCQSHCICTCTTVHCQSHCIYTCTAVHCQSHCICTCTTVHCLLGNLLFQKNPKDYTGPSTWLVCPAVYFTISIFLSLIIYHLTYSHLSNLLMTSCFSFAIALLFRSSCCTIFSPN